MRTDFVGVNPEEIDPEILSRAAEAIRQSKLVAFPTETVYGIAVRADDPKAVQRLHELKGSSPEKPLTIHLPDRDRVSDHVPVLPPLARRLADRYWPGPLTLVLQGSDRKKVGIRVPANPIAQALLAGTGRTVLATSANRSGQRDAVTGQEVRAEFDGELDWILDGGRCELSQPSTVVEVGKTWRLLREGFIDERAVRNTLSRLILVVCSGNTCRSPMAAAILRSKLGRKLGIEISDLDQSGFVVRSAGTMAFAGGPASNGANQAMIERGLDLEDHVTTPLTLELLQEARLVLTMTEEQRRIILAMTPESEDRVFLVDPEGGNTLDPFGGPLEIYRRTAEQLDRHLERWVEGLLSVEES